MKLTDEQRRTMLEDVLVRHKPRSLVAKEYGINLGRLKEYIARARIHGIDAVLHSSNVGSYPVEFKLEVAQSIADGATYGEAAAKFNLSWSIARSWYLTYTEGGEEALAAKKKGRPVKKKSKPIPETLDPKDREILELKEKLRQAEIENALLKKLDALVRERIEREEKRK